MSILRKLMNRMNSKPDLAIISLEKQLKDLQRKVASQEKDITLLKKVSRMLYMSVVLKRSDRSSQVSQQEVQALSTSTPK